MNQKQKQTILAVWRQFELGAKEGLRLAEKMRAVDVGPADAAERLAGTIMSKHMDDMITQLTEAKRIFDAHRGAREILDIAGRNRAKPLSLSKKT